MAANYRLELLKIMLLGDGGVGKSVLTIQFTSNKFVEEYDPTIENCYRKTLNVDTKVCVLDILDTAGRDEYQTMIDSYIRNVHGYVLVYSITDENTFFSINKYIEKIHRVHEDKGIPAVLVGNKCDLEEMRSVSYEAGADLAKSVGIPFVETSAKTRINVDEAFIEAVRIVRQHAMNDMEDDQHKRCKIL
ncbi:Ras [Entamoeba marina]